MLACVLPNTEKRGVPDYRKEPPLSEADRASAKAKAKARKATLYALTVVCHDEADQKSLFTQARRAFGPRRIRVVVS